MAICFDCADLSVCGDAIIFVCVFDAGPEKRAALLTEASREGRGMLTHGTDT